MTSQDGFQNDLFHADVVQSVTDLLNLESQSCTLATAPEAIRRLSSQVAFLASSRGDVYWGSRTISTAHRLEGTRLQAEIAGLWHLAQEMMYHETIRSRLVPFLKATPNDVHSIAKACTSALVPPVAANMIDVDLNPLLFALFAIIIGTVRSEVFRSESYLTATDLERLNLKVPEITLPSQEGSETLWTDDSSLPPPMITDSPLTLFLKYFPGLRGLADDLLISGLKEPAVFTLIKAIAKLEDRSTIMSALKKALLTLEESKQERAAVQREFIKRRQNGEFSRSILSVQSARGCGSAFVVGQVNRYYILMSNSHVTGEAKYVLLRSSAPDEEEVGTASVVLANRMNFPETGDLAILVIEAPNVRGRSLLPISIAGGNVTTGGHSTLASGQNATVSTGVVVSIQENNVMILLGAQTIPGDSGSPYLVKTGEGYEAVAVNARIGALGMLLSRTVVDNMLRAF